MKSPSVALLCFLVLSSSIPIASAFNITTILNNFPDFILFNTLLSQTGLSPNINSRSTITVLAIDNATASQLTSRSNELLRNILSIHVLLDYFDSMKFSRMKVMRSIQVTNLFQSSGLAQGRQGFINITKLPNNQVSFASAVPGSNSNVRFIGVLATQPYNISVLHVSGIVIAPGIDDTLVPPPKMPDPPPPPVPVPSPPSPEAAEPPVEGSPTESPTAPSGSPAPAPAPAPSPEADSPSEDTDPDDEDSNDSDSDSDSSSSRPRSIVVGFLASVVLAMAMNTIAS